MSECYHPGEQVEMIEGSPLKKSFDVNQAWLFNVFHFFVWIMHEVIIFKWAK